MFCFYGWKDWGRFGFERDDERASKCDKQALKKKKREETHTAMYRSRWLDAAGRLLSIAGTATLLSSPASAEVQFEGSLPSELEMETSYTVRWSTDADNVKITMVSGSESGNNIYHLYDLVCNIWLVNNLSNACTTSETSLDWKPPDDLPIGHYMLMATAADDSDAFSNQFNLVEAGDAVSWTLHTQIVEPSVREGSLLTHGLLAAYQTSHQPGVPAEVPAKGRQ